MFVVRAKLARRLSHYETSRVKRFLLFAAIYQCFQKISSKLDEYLCNRLALVVNIQLLLSASHYALSLYLTNVLSLCVIDVKDILRLRLFFHDLYCDDLKSLLRNNCWSVISAEMQHVVCSINYRCFEFSKKLNRQTFSLRTVSLLVKSIKIVVMFH